MMDNKKMASELIKLAKELMSAEYQDSPEDIAEDVWSLMIYKKMDILKAFKSIGYVGLYKKTRESDFRDGLDIKKDSRAWKKDLAKVISKAMRR